MSGSVYSGFVEFVRPVEAVIPGVQGRILAVLAGTTAELNLRTIARLAGVSLAQASRVLPELVELGMVERREVPPSSQFRLAREHVASRVVLELAGVRDTVLAALGTFASEVPIPPANVIVFGSLARGVADRASDIDAVIVRPDGVSSDDPAWERSIDSWRELVRALTGNRVEVVEIGADTVAARLRGRSPLWRDVRRDGITVFGSPLTDVEDAVRA
jgi:DNA-binding transcriptional ArsR family regulator